MGIVGRKTGESLQPLLVGLVIGVLISYCIRLISKPTCLHKTEPHPTPFVPKVAELKPDQVVNLAFEPDQEEHKKEAIIDSFSVENIPAVNSSEMVANRPKKLLFVGIMTASAFLTTRAKAVWETWANDIPGKVMFFTGADSYEESNQRKDSNESMPLILLPGVDDSYPPQKKSFMMIKYMHDNFKDEFEWFMRADDDVYVRGEKLAEFLRSVDSRHAHFIGQAGKGNRVEKGTLNLAHNENFCMGGPGILMSQTTLRKLAPNVQDCLKDMYSTHEDVELGRCVQRFVGVSCTWAYEMQTIFHHNSSGEVAFTGKLKRREVNKAITLHPIKNFHHMYRIHLHFLKLKVQESLHKEVLLLRDLKSIRDAIGYTNHISNSEEFLDQQLDKQIEEAGQPPALNQYSPRTVKDAIPWDFMQKGIYSSGSISPRHKLRSDGKEALEDVVRDVIDDINAHSRARGRIVEFKDVLYGYRRVNPVIGSQYVLDLLMTYRKYRGRKMTIPVRRHVYVQKSFSPLQCRVLPSHESAVVGIQSHERTRLIMIVPLFRRLLPFDRFLDNFVFVCNQLYSKPNGTKANNEANEKLGNVSFDLSLIVVLFGTNEEKAKFLLLVQKKKSLLPESNGVPLCQIKMVQIDAEFSRGIALETGISQCDDDDLLLLIDVDLTFTASAVKRVFHHTKQKRQAYFPVVFSQYNPKFYAFSSNNEIIAGSSSFRTDHKYSSTNFEINAETGYWREFGYGIAAFYKSDFRLAGGFDTSIRGWGKEDVALFDRFLQHTNISIFRAHDPDLIHIFHDTDCDSTLSRVQYDMCIGSQASTLGSERNLMKYILQRT